MGVAAAMKLPVEEERNLPLEIVEEILLNLPVKSLLRFCAVSEAWNTMISDRGFIRRHRTRAALSGRERALISQSMTGYLYHAATLPLSSMIPSQAIRNKTPLILPFRFYVPAAVGIRLLASCGDLFFVANNKSSLLLWNYSMRTYKKLPNPSMIDPDSVWYYSGIFDFGIGYDSLGDDYKILKLASHECPELYSLRSDSWKKIPPFPRSDYRSSEIVFASGALYWVIGSRHGAVVVSFDLSTEKYAEVLVQPPYDPLRFELGDQMELSVIRGKLCLHLNYNYRKKYVLWVMEDCNSWIKMLDIDHFSFTLLNLDEAGEEVQFIGCLTVLYYYDNGNILIKALTHGSFHPIIFNYEDDKSIPRRWYGRRYPNFDLCVESLVSPATYCSRPQPPETLPTETVSLRFWS